MSEMGMKDLVLTYLAQQLLGPPHVGGTQPKHFIDGPRSWGLDLILSKLLQCETCI